MGTPIGPNGRPWAPNGPSMGAQWTPMESQWEPMGAPGAPMGSQWAPHGAPWGSDGLPTAAHGTPMGLQGQSMGTSWAPQALGTISGSQCFKNISFDVKVNVFVTRTRLQLVQPVQLVYLKWCPEVLLGTPLPHAPGVRIDGS